MPDQPADAAPQNDVRPAAGSNTPADESEALGIQEPPTALSGILRQLGPGLIIAASIVGSGELIATTKTGAQAGISLLWLIIIGCVIKGFVQIELGRYTVGHSETTLTALNRVPGPRFIVNWIVWYWLVMMIIGFGQLGGIIGGVGQSLALAFPIKGDYQNAIRLPAPNELKRYLAWQEDIEQHNGVELAKLSESRRLHVTRSQAIVADKLQKLEPAVANRALGLVTDLITAERTQAPPEQISALKKQIGSELEPSTIDDKYWSVGIALITIALLVRGRYGMLQTVSTVLVVAFTFITVGNVLAIQFQTEFGLSAGDMLRALIPRLPEAGVSPPGLPGWTVAKPIATALATFGIIGVGATELIMYPYWCQEKGYARFVGPNTGDAAWYRRANGWITVMKYDAFASMIIYTLATLAFFFMGVAVLHQQGLDPEGMRMVSTLMEQYVPVFGEYARWLFLVGAIAVLYSTYLVANASFTRVYTDAFKVFGLMSRDNPEAHRKSIAILSVVLPLISMTLWCIGANPVKLVLLGGIMQAIMLPMLGLAAIYLRYVKTEDPLKPGRLWDACLIISSIGLLIAGGYGVYTHL